LTPTAVGPLGERWPDVERIVVLRGGGLGDLLSAVPAIEALKAAYAGAEVVVLCAPNNAALLADRPSPVDRAVGLPYARGVHGPNDGPGEEKAFNSFRQSVADRPVDLGVQLHGGGRWSNPFLLGLKPRWTVGTRTPDADPLTRWLPYRQYQHEVMRWLEVVGLAGASAVSMTPRIEPTAAELDKARSVLPESELPTVGLHPGARDPRRRWPPEHFAALAERCIDEGRRVALIGSRAERRLLRDIAAKVSVLGGTEDRVLVLDQMDMPTLVGVLAHTDVLVGNDSGVRHLAQAVGTATVGIYWIGNAFNAGPLGRARHRMFMSWTIHCPVCGQDCPRTDTPRCGHDVSFVADVSVDEVIDEVQELLDSQTVLGFPAPGRRFDRMVEG
jgi:ADP-heptose:LPS heptosyltransferase